ncbi:MAG: flippase, partial [Anaerolineae bacterium]
MTLAQRSVRSAGYTIASSGLQAVVQFVRAIILARLLSPEHFGVYAYAASFVMSTYTL